jgi:hypothetical protein
MCDENVSYVKIPMNYSGFCENTLFTNEDLLKLTDPEKDAIHGPSLFALKYRLLPCKATGKNKSNLGYFILILIRN